MTVTFPSESPEYRSARADLLTREVALRREMEAVATQLRALPPGGEVAEDYLFDCIGADGAPDTIRLSELFAGGDTLLLYHYMFPRHTAVQRSGPTAGATAQLPLLEGPCPSCTALIDMWDGTLPHFEGLGGRLAVVAKAPIERVAAFARDKGWQHTRLLSAAHNSFKRDYHGEDADGEQQPMMTVFKRWPDGAIRLHWASELLFEPTDPGQDPRHMGTVEPLWTLFDLTPAGRPQGDEQIEYDCCRPGGRRAQ